jgi:N-acetyl-anhydromuramyl-L-alanine amidase AmpD
MSKGNALIQEGLNSLGYIGRNGKPLATDGLFGPNTEHAAREWLTNDGRPRSTRPQKDDEAAPPPAATPAASGLVRVILHWTAGTYVVSSSDRKAYHYIIGGDGATVDGTHKPEDNRSTADGHYAAHTRACNTGSIGIAVAGMHGATERPFSAGGFPMREIQVDALVRLTADVCRRYGIPVTPRTVLTHAEVQPVLGITQSGKWDIRWLPNMASAGDPIAIGNILRGRIAASS